MMIWCISNDDWSYPRSLLSESELSHGWNHRVHILVEMKQGQCIWPLSWSVHCNFTGDGKCNERGWACTPHPYQPGLILPSSLNVRQKAAVATLCTLWLKSPLPFHPLHLLVRVPPPLHMALWTGWGRAHGSFSGWGGGGGRRSVRGRGGGGGTLGFLPLAAYVVLYQIKLTPAATIAFTFHKNHTKPLPVLTLVIFSNCRAARYYSAKFFCHAVLSSK
jgi:hypothetical protein